ncbi:unnamed protein product [Trichobilharzia regenti]|nr:unnamed protein product [Trichobilharzia regenti]
MFRLELTDLYDCIDKANKHLLYMNNILRVCKDKIEVEMVLEELNLCHASKKFAAEREDNAIIHSLNVNLLKQADRTVARSIYMLNTKLDGTVRTFQ